MQVEETRYHFTPMRLAHITKIEMNVGGRVAGGGKGPSFTTGVWLGQSLWKTTWRQLKN